MTKAEQAWTKCRSPNSSGEAVLSCAECRAFEYRKCDNCPASAFTIWAGEPQDPMESIRLSRWIGALGPHVRGISTVAA
jgi:hypothetical protein